MAAVWTEPVPNLLLVTLPEANFASVTQRLARAEVEISPSPTLSEVIASLARAAVAITPAAKNEEVSRAPDAIAEDVTLPEPSLAEVIEESARADVPTADEAILAATIAALAI